MKRKNIHHRVRWADIICKGKPKNSGARVVLKVSAGEVEMVDPKEDKA